MECTENENQNEMPLIDDVPFPQRYRRIPPMQWQAVKDHIKQLLDSKMGEQQSLIIIFYSSKEDKQCQEC